MKTQTTRSPILSTKRNFAAKLLAVAALGLVAIAASSASAATRNNAGRYTDYFGSMVSSVVNQLQPTYLKSWSATVRWYDSGHVVIYSQDGWWQDGSVSVATLYGSWTANPIPNGIRYQTRGYAGNGNWNAFDKLSVPAPANSYDVFPKGTMVMPFAFEAGTTVDVTRISAEEFQFFITVKARGTPDLYSTVIVR